MKNKKTLFVELPPADFEKLEKIVNSGKYASKADFVRTKIRLENVSS